MSIAASQSFATQADAASPTSEDWQLHAQTTWTWQRKAAFSAPYSGERSLSPNAEKDYAFSATLFAGWRLATGTEVYINPELVQGVPMSGLAGLGGLSNGELQKTAGAHLTLYRARLFMRQRWDFSEDTETIDSDANQLAGVRSTDRFTFTAGNLAVSDIFDTNSFAHDARSQFMNWALISHGAYDFAADARGYALGAALEYNIGPWAVRAGRFALPKVPNGANLDTRFGAHHGDQIELERGYSMGEQAGKAKLLWFRNTMVSGRFDDALGLAARRGDVADTSEVRHRTHKAGWGLGWEQALNNELGMFARMANSDGASEVVAFAEIDRSASLGAVLRGPRWQRPEDTVGLAWARNQLSSNHQRYLASGAIGYFVGDGHLNYRAESILEGYYSLGLVNAAGLRRSTVSIDAQRIRNPAYNQDRGPVNIWSIRLHTEI